MELDNSSGDWELKAGTLMFAREVICNLLERLEDLFDLLGGNADSRIANQKY